MKLNRNHIFLIAVGLILCTILLDKGYFLLRSERTTGIVIGTYEPRTEGIYGGSSFCPKVKFMVDDSTVTFIGSENFNYKFGDVVDVVYFKSNFKKASIYSFADFWLPGFMRGIFPLIILCAAILAFIDPKDTLRISFRRFKIIEKVKKTKNVKRLK